MKTVLLVESVDAATSLQITGGLRPAVREEQKRAVTINSVDNDFMVTIELFQTIPRDLRAEVTAKGNFSGLFVSRMSNYRNMNWLANSENKLCRQCGFIPTHEDMCPYCLFGTALEVEPELPEFSAGTQVENYRISTRLGTGGFGDVYLAEQDKPVKRTVALKVIKPGMDSREIIGTLRGRTTGAGDNGASEHRSCL